MEKEEKMKEGKPQNGPNHNPEEEQSNPNSEQSFDNETIQILLDDRISTGG